jgi:hypothetical protein
MVLSGAGYAQTTGTVNPGDVLAEPSAKEDAPPGGCMPIGLTASGDIVFPFQCKGFIERHREKAVDEKAVEEKPASSAANSSEQKPGTAEIRSAITEQQPLPAEEKPPAKQSAEQERESLRSINGIVETASISKRDKNEPRRNFRGSEGCQRYRTYDAASNSYRGYDRRRHACR